MAIKIDKWTGPTRLYVLVRERSWQGIPVHLRLQMQRGESSAKCETLMFENQNGVMIPKHIHLRPGEALNIKGHVFRVEEPIVWTGASGEMNFNRCWNSPDEDAYPFKLVQKPLYVLPFYLSFRLTYESPVGQFAVNTFARFANGAYNHLFRLHEHLDEDSRLSQMTKLLMEYSLHIRDKCCEYSFKVRIRLHCLRF